MLKLNEIPENRLVTTILVSLKAQHDLQLVDVLKRLSHDQAQLVFVYLISKNAIDEKTTQYNFASKNDYENIY